MNRAYRLTIAYYLCFALMMLLSSVALFALKVGFSYESVLLYYAGSEEQFMRAKSAEGLWETAWRHLGSMGLFIMVTAHFMLFGKKEERGRTARIAALLFASALAIILPPFAIAQGYALFVWVKLLGLFTLSAGLLRLYALLLKSLSHR